MASNAHIPPSAGERNAATGYLGQYTACATLILRSLHDGTLEAIRLADPSAGRVDDFVCLSTGRVDAYQVKWGLFAGDFVFNDLSSQSNEARGLIRDLAEGWVRLQAMYPGRVVTVHLLTNDSPHARISTAAFLPVGNPLPDRPHFAAFLTEAWPTWSNAQACPEHWRNAWERLQRTSGLTPDEFARFAKQCHFDCRFLIDPPPSVHARDRERFEADRSRIRETVFELVASPDRVIKLSREDLLQHLGWQLRTTFRHAHRFPIDPRYQPDTAATADLLRHIDSTESGYLAVIGPPGSGKSSFLTETLRQSPHDVVSYYAFVPGTASMGPARGEAESFLHDLAIALRHRLLSGATGLVPVDLAGLRADVTRQLIAASERYTATGRKLIILVDGLDHIEREQRPQLSLLNELPNPDSVPRGVLFILGSQRLDMLASPIRGALATEGRCRTMSPMTRAAALTAIDACAELKSLAVRQRERVITLAGGLPLALIYLLNHLLDAPDADTIDRRLSSETAYTGDIDRLYFPHWDQVSADDSTVTLLGCLSRWRGPFSPRWFATWAGEREVRQLFEHFRHLFHRETSDRWTFFHNSFRLFLLEHTAKGVDGNHDPAMDHRFHERLAEACSTSPDLFVSSQALFHWSSAGDHSRVLAAARSESFREQFVAMRPSHAIAADLAIAIRSAFHMNDVVAFGQLVLAGFELYQREEATEGLDFADRLLEVGAVDQAISHLRDGRSRLVDEEICLAKSLRLLSAGLSHEARLLFDLSEPLDDLKSEIPLRAASQGPHSTMCIWAEVAPHFRGLDDVLRVIDRVQQEADLSLSVEDKSEQATARLRAEMLNRAGRAAIQRGNVDALKTIVDRFDRKNGWHAGPRMALLLHGARTFASRSDHHYAEWCLRRAVWLARRWMLDADQLLDLCDCLWEIVGRADLAKAFFERIELPLKDEDRFGRMRLGPQNVRFRYARMHTLLIGELTLSSFVPDAALEHDQASVHVAREHCRIATVWGLAWKRKALSPVFVAERCRGTLLLFHRAYERGLIHDGWHRLTDQRSALYDSMVRAYAAHGPDVLAELVKEIETVWHDKSLGRHWHLPLRRDVLMSLLAVGWNLKWIKQQLSELDGKLWFDDKGPDNVELGIRQADAWYRLGFSDRAKELTQTALRASVRPYHDEDDQLEYWTEWLGIINAEDPTPAHERIAEFARIVHLADQAGGIPTNRAAENLLRTAWKSNPGFAIALRRWFTDVRVIGFKSGVKAILESAVESSPALARDACRLVVSLLGWDSRNIPEETIIKLTQALVETNPRQFADVLHWMKGAINTQVCSGNRNSWLRGVRKGLEDRLGVGANGFELDNNSSESDVDHSFNEPFTTLEGGKTLRGAELREALRPFERLVQTLRAIQREVYDRASFRLTDVLGNLDLAQLTTVEGLVREKGLQAEILLDVADAMRRRGAPERAEALATTALAEGMVSSWFASESGVKRRAAAILVAIDPNRGQKFVRETFVSDITDSLYNFRSAACDLRHLCNLLFGEMRLSPLWDEVRDYLRTLYPEAVAPAPPGALLAACVNTPPARALSELVFDCVVHPASTLSHQVTQSVLAGLGEGSTVSATVIELLLSGTSSQQCLGLAVLQAATQRTERPARQWMEQILSLSTSDDLAVRVAVRDLCEVEGWNSPTLRAANATFGARFDLELPRPRTLASPDGRRTPTPPGETIRDSTNPAELFFLEEVQLRMLAKMSDVPLGTLYQRAAELMPSIAPIEQWNASGESKLREINKAAGLDLAYRRPRIQVAHKAVCRLASELMDCGRILEDSWPDLATYFREYDADALRIVPVARLPDIPRIPVGEHNYVDPRTWSAGVSADPLLAKGSELLPIVVAESTEVSWLDEAIPEEARVSGLCCHDDEDRDDTPFRSERWLSIADYRAKRSERGSGSLVVKGWGIEPFVTEGWLALDPHLGTYMGWRLDSEGLFRWIDPNGEIAIESVYWSDGTVMLARPARPQEVARGWAVLASKTATEELIRRVGTLYRHFRVERTVRGEAGERTPRQRKGCVPFQLS